MIRTLQQLNPYLSLSIQRVIPCKFYKSTFNSTQSAYKMSTIRVINDQDNKFNFSTALNQQFAAQQQEFNPLDTSLYIIKESCFFLLRYDSLTLDSFVKQFVKQYHLRTSTLSIDEQNQHKRKAIQGFNIVYKEPTEGLPKHQKQLDKDGDMDRVYDELALIYEFLTAARVGFLRGDLHSHTIFKLHKYTEEKLTAHQKKELRKAILFQDQDFRAVFNLCTQPKHFRLPFYGIYNRQLECSINLYQRQLILQRQSQNLSQDKFKSILQSLIKLNRVQQSQLLRKIILKWLLTLVKSLKLEQNKCRLTQLKGNRQKYAPQMLKMSIQKIGGIALSQLMVDIFAMVYKNEQEDVQISELDGISQKTLIKNIAKNLYIQSVTQEEVLKFRQSQHQYDQIIKSYVPDEDPQNADITPGKQMNRKLQTYIKLTQKNNPYGYVTKDRRTQFIAELQAKIGKKFSLFKSEIQQQRMQRFEELSKMITYLMRDLIKVQNKYGLSVPLLTVQHKFTKKFGKVFNSRILMVNDDFLNDIIPKLQKHENLFMHMQASIPTIIMPMPWIDPEIGGYYSQATSVMRYSNCPVQERWLKHADNERIYNVLNELGNVKWKINKDVLNLVEEIWKEGGGLHYIPKRYSDGKITYYLTEKKRQKNLLKLKDLDKKIQQLRDDHSLRSDFLLKLNIARSFKDLDYFYFPHNLDFRGRVYPIPPHFNHIGNDLVRGLLLFGQGKQLGQSGVKWLKIHCANLMGKDKATIREKLQYIQQNLELIKQIANEPLKNRVWLTYEDSWQAIASIIQLSNALASPDPTKYVSYLHVHQDGSCNGLQHYAALGRDMEGAYQVNLGATERPGDVYTHVANMVKAAIEKDKLDPSSKYHQLSLILTDHIKRKTIKQTVMTSVYGVTFVGAREQIYRQLRDQNATDEQQTYRASLYVAKLTMDAISNLFRGAHQIKKWFRECARRVVNNQSPLGWISPLGLPIVQPYRKEGYKDSVAIPNNRLSIIQSNQNLPINKSKQVTAFPPNFVHSLDSTHMMYTCMQCKNQNITFAAVHDSYWAHAGNVQQMNSILRDQFIRLHSEPLLENFKESLEKRFPDENFPQIPKRGQFKLQTIKESLYFFS